MKFKTVAGNFRLMSEGVKSLRISSVELKPKVNPEMMEVVFEDDLGATVRNNYTFDEKNEIGSFVTSVLLQACFGDIEEFETDEADKLVGCFVEAEIVHSNVPSKKDPSKTMTFANIKRIYGEGVPFETKKSTNRPKL